MNLDSQETLRRIGQNDATLTCLQINHSFAYDNTQNGEFKFTSRDGNDFSQLGGAIRENTHLKKLDVLLSGSGLDVTNRGFFDGLKHNSSITGLEIHFCDHNILSADIDGGRTSRTRAGQVGQEILRAFQENNSNLTQINIHNAYLPPYGGDIFIATSLRSCTHLRTISLTNSNITDEQLLPMVEAIRGHPSVEVLNLNGNRIGNAGCETIARLLSNPNCNLRRLQLSYNHRIDIEGATTLANSLSRNVHLHELYLFGNPIDGMQDTQGVVVVEEDDGDIFSRLLCNTSTINDTYSSNHTLEYLGLPHRSEGDDLALLLHLNKDADKGHVAIKKILNYHENIDMEPFFEWNTEGEGERNLKALPFVVAWFERAREAVADGEEWGSYNIDERKLSAVYQFAHAMPLLFVPALHHTKGENNKRKRE